MIPLYNTDGSSTCPLGMPMCQNRLAVPTWSYAMEVRPPARIVELGSMNGGFTIALGVHAYHLGAKVISYDRQVAPSEHFAALGAFLGIAFRSEVDMWDAAIAKEIAALIAKPGVTYVLCDGGNKPRELMTFAAFLKPGDIIAAHDYCAEAPGTLRGEITNYPWWPWAETTAADGARAATAHGLCPWLQDHFDMAGWLTFEKPA